MLERDGLVRRAPDPADGRSSRVTPTEVAEARLPDALAALLRGNQEVLRDLTAEQAGLLVALLTRLSRGPRPGRERRRAAPHAVL